MNKCSKVVIVFARDDGTLPDPDYVSKVFQHYLQPLVRWIEDSSRYDVLDVRKDIARGRQEQFR